MKRESMKMNVMATACRLLLVLGVVWAAGNSASAQTDCAPANVLVYEPMESDPATSLWQTKHLEDGSLQLVTNPVFAGQFSWQIALHPGDQLNDSGTTERDELEEQSNLETPELAARRTTLHYYLPADFPQVDDRLVLTQWKQTDPTGALSDSPVFALRYRLGVMWVNVQIDRVTANRITIWSTTAEMRGRWFTLRYETVFDRTGSVGHQYVWLDGVQVANYNGITAYPTSFGYPDPSQQTFYFKFGLYRDVWPDPWVAYFDEYWRCQAPF